MLSDLLKIFCLESGRLEKMVFFWIFYYWLIFVFNFFIKMFSIKKFLFINIRYKYVDVYVFVMFE